jgi:hypothetical protein
MGEMMTKNKSRQKTKPSVLVKWGKKLLGVFEWIAESQPADALCKG